MNRQFGCVDEALIASDITPKRMHPMAFSASKIAFLKNFKSRRKVSALAVLAVVAATSTPAGAGSARPGAYDGTWNVTFTTRAGNCSSTNSAPFSVAGTRVSSAGGGKVTGGVRANGTLAVNISVGLSHASGTGRLA